MSSKKDFRIYIEDMIASIDRIFTYLENTDTIEQFLANDMLIDAVTRHFEIIGEAANKVPKEIKTQYSIIPWRQMYGLRNLAIHEYGLIDPLILWEIATKNLSKNREDLKAILLAN